MTTESNSAVQTYIEAAGAGLWGLVTRALMEEGQTATLAAMDAVQAGRAFVQIEVLFTKRGMAASGQVCSHGERSNLFSVTLNQPPLPDVPPTPTARH